MGKIRQIAQPSKAKQRFVMQRRTPMATTKQIVHEIAEQLPEQATLEDAMYSLYVRQKLERSMQAAKEGKVTSQEDARKRFLNDPR